MAEAPMSGPTTAARGGRAGGCDLSVVVPVHNERENLRPLLSDVQGALEPTGLRW